MWTRNLGCSTRDGQEYPYLFWAVAGRISKISCGHEELFGARNLSNLAVGAIGGGSAAFRDLSCARFRRVVSPYVPVVDQASSEQPCARRHGVRPPGY